MSDSNLFRLLPKVDELLRTESIATLESRFPRSLLRYGVQEAIETLRDSLRSGKIQEEKLRKITQGQEMAARVIAVLEKREGQRMQKAVNATGVVLHTGLGRAPLAPAAAAAATNSAGYCLLEIDCESGERGQRDRTIEKSLQLLFGCEAAAAVNNNAAATLLAVNSFAKGKEVLVSRGELVEIGGSYRMPEVMKAGSAKLVEVGTTNRTRLEDYQNAITKKTGLILKVHSSNFRIEGFTESTKLEELAALARERGIPIVHDLGSGLCVESKIPGLEEEPRVLQSLRAGVDLVTFSGDKLLGGPQAGLLLGKKEAIAKIRKNPLFRALRLGKQSIAALEATLQIYLRGEEEALREIPSLRMLRASKEELAVKAQSLAQGIRSLGIAELSISLESSTSQAGSGSAPAVELPTQVVALSHSKLSATKLAAKLRAANPPVFSRIENDRVLLDARTLLDGDESAIVGALSSLLQKT